jgi:hypothetical protein
MISSTESKGGKVFDRSIVREGVVAGLIGAAIVAAWFLVLDAVVGRLFFTPAALGSALFLGAEGVAAVRITAGPVLGYTVVHLAAFMMVGVLFAAAAVKAEAHRSVLMAIVLFFVASLTLVVGLMAIVATWILVALTWWAIAIGNLLAAVAMAMYLRSRHPALARDLPRAEERAAAEDGTAGPGWQGPGPGRQEPEPHYRPRGPSTPEGGKPVD